MSQDSAMEARSGDRSRFSRVWSLNSGNHGNGRPSLNTTRSDTSNSSRCTSFNNSWIDLEAQKVFNMPRAQFGLIPGVDVLGALVSSSGATVEELGLECFFHSQLVVFQFRRFFSMIGGFPNLHTVAINYCCIDEDLVRHWASSLKGILKNLRIRVCVNESYEHIIPNDAWSSLTSACPALTVDMSLLGIGHSSHLTPILSPSIPVTKLQLWSGYDNDNDLLLCPVLNHVCNYYHQRLHRLDFEFENYHDNVDDALLRCLSRCRNLTSLRVKANISVQVAVAICHLIQERRNNLTSIDLMLCDISGQEMDHLRDLREQMEPFVEERGIVLTLHDDLF